MVHVTDFKIAFDENTAKAIDWFEMLWIKMDIIILKCNHWSLEFMIWAYWAFQMTKNDRHIVFKSKCVQQVVMVKETWLKAPSWANIQLRDTHCAWFYWINQMICAIWYASIWFILYAAYCMSMVQGRLKFILNPNIEHEVNQLWDSIPN